MKEKLLISIRKRLAVTLAFLLCWLMIRGYEWISVSLKIENGEVAMKGMGILYDLSAGIAIAFVVVVLCSAISFLNARLAYILNVLLFATALLMGFAVTHYFVTTLLPLSSDLFGYSLDEIILTISSSGGLSFGAALFCVMVVGAFFGFIFLFRKKNIFNKVGPVSLLFITIVGLTSLLVPIRPMQEDVEHDIDYHFAVNKFSYLATQTKVYLQSENRKILFSKDSYPFLHSIEYADPLGKYLNKADSNPNFVFIIVEGLGRDFIGSDAKYAGFTPFLDSLLQKSLYWKNALSNAGRTFGAPPSILGSLPYSRSGLMNYGSSIPDHQTIISLLKPFGYRSTFFYGGNPNFDNLDIFLEQQGIYQFVNESNIPVSPERHKSASGWGYSDADVFSFASRLIEKDTGPRLDFYLTLSTHEPFICPDPMIQQEANEIIDKLPTSVTINEIKSNRNIFECLLYTDNAIRNLIGTYSKRADFLNTVFIITGDHRLIPMPSENQISRFHVPLIIYSPLLKENKVFSSLAIHSAITPTLLGLLHGQYGMTFPAQMPFISKTLLTDSVLTSNLDLALIRNKNSVSEYVEGDYFLSDGRLYKIGEGMDLMPVNDALVKSRLQQKLADFQARSIFACDGNRLDKSLNKVQLIAFTLTKGDRQFLLEQRIESLNPDQQFERARQLAFAKEYSKSRIINKNLLNRSPNYHDARILLARTFGWEKQYDSATLFIRQVIQRAPQYVDAYVALSDFEFWQGHMQKSLDLIEQGLQSNSSNPDLLIRKARALSNLNRKPEAKRVLNFVMKNGSRDEMALALLQKLKNN